MNEQTEINSKTIQTTGLGAETALSDPDKNAQLISGEDKKLELHHQLPPDLQAAHVLLDGDYKEDTEVSVVLQALINEIPKNDSSIIDSNENFFIAGLDRLKDNSRFEEGKSTENPVETKTIRLKNAVEFFRQKGILPLMAQLLKQGWEIGDFKDNFFSKRLLPIRFSETARTDPELLRRLELRAEMIGKKNLSLLFFIDTILDRNNDTLINSITNFAQESGLPPEEKVSFLREVLKIDHDQTVQLAGINEILSLDQSKLSDENKKKQLVLFEVKEFNSPIFWQFCLEHTDLLLDGQKVKKPLDEEVFFAFIKFSGRPTGRNEDQKAAADFFTVSKIFFESEFAPPLLKNLNTLFQGQIESVVSVMISNPPEKIMVGGSLTEHFLELFFKRKVVPDWYIERILEDPTIISLSPKSKELWQKYLQLDKRFRPYLRDILSDPTQTNEKKLVFVAKIEALVKVIQDSGLEIQKFDLEIIDATYKSDFTVESLQRITQVLESDYPEVVKINYLFEMIFLRKDEQTNKTLLFEILKNSLAGNSATEAELSPVLSQASERRQIHAIYNDLLKIHLEANNPGLMRYLKLLEDAERLIRKFESGSELVSKEADLLAVFIEKFQVLHNKRGVPTSTGEINADLKSLITSLRNQLGVPAGSSVVDRICRMYFGSLGLKTLSEVQGFALASREKANQRNTEFAQKSLEEGKNFTLAEGDLLKGINFDFVDAIFVNGNTAPQFLGVFQKDVLYDRTAFDTDTSRVLAGDVSSDMNTAISKSMAKNYAGGSKLPNKEGLILVVKDRGQFQETNRNNKTAYKKNTYETFLSFPNNPDGKRHVGIRTGFPPTEIDAFVALDALLQDQDQLESLYFYIALNKVYIPVVDKHGRYIYTPELHQKYQDSLQELPDFFKNEIKGESLLQLLHNSEGFKKLLEMKLKLAGGENLTLYEHTQAVLKQYQRYFSGTQTQSYLSESQMVTLLSLHDIGKTLTQIVTGSAERQHEFTGKIIPRILESSPWSAQEVGVILEVVRNDILGQAFQGKIEPAEAVARIKKISRSLGVKSADLLQVWYVYFIADASSYTTDAGSPKGVLENKFVIQREPGAEKGTIHLAPELQKIFEEIQANI